MMMNKLAGRGRGRPRPVCPDTKRRQARTMPPFNESHRPRSGGSTYGTASGGAESLNVAALPGRLDRPSVVVLSDEGNCLVGGHAVQHSETGEGGARSTATATASDFDSFGLCSPPSHGQSVSCVIIIPGQPEVRPPNPTHVPAQASRWFAEQVEPEVWEGTLGRRPAQPSAAETRPDVRHNTPAAESTSASRPFTLR